MHSLTCIEATTIVEHASPLADGNRTNEIIFSIDRPDVCVVKHTVNGGPGRRYDVLYCVWKDDPERVKCMEIRSGKETGEYLHLRSVTLHGDGKIYVDFGSSYAPDATQWDELRIISVIGSRPVLHVPVY